MTDTTDEPRGGLSRRNALIGGALACASGFAFLRQPAIANPVIAEAAAQGIAADDSVRCRIDNGQQICVL